MSKMINYLQLMIMRKNCLKLIPKLKMIF